MSDLTFLSAVVMAQQIREKKISPVELVDAHLAKIERLNPKLNAFVHVDAERARREARDRRRLQVDEGQTSRPAARRSDQHQEFAGCRGNAMRSGDPPARWVRRDARCAAGRAPAQRGRDRARRDQHAGTADGVGDRQSFVRPHQQPVGSRAHAGRFQWRRSGGDRGRDVGGRRGQRRRRIDPRARAFQRHLRTETHAGAHSRQPATFRRPAGPFALLGVVGPMARTRGRSEGFVRSDARSGRWRHLRRAGAAALAGDDEVRKLRIGYFEDDGRTPGHTGNSRSGANRGGCPAERGFQVEHFRPRGLEEARCSGRSSSSLLAAC